MRRTGSLAWRPAPVRTPRRSLGLPGVRLLRAAAALPFRVQLWPILFLAAGLRLAGIGGYDLSLDEAISHFIINRPLPEIVSYCLSRAYEHPPTYYLLLRVWTMLTGNSEFALRWFSAGVGLLNITVLAVLARRWFGPRVALWAALLMAVWPLTLQQARDARMYPLLSLVALLTVLAFDRAIRYNRWRDWGLFLALFTFALSIHYLVGFSAVAFALIYLLWWRRRPELRVRFGVTLALLIGLPLLVITAAPGPRASMVSFIQYGLMTPWSPARLVPIYAGWVLGVLAEMWPSWAALAVSTLPWLLFVLGVAGPYASIRRGGASDRDIRLALLLLVLVPALAGSLVFFFVAPRHHSALSGLFILGVALGLDRVSRRIPFVAVLAGLAIGAGSLVLAMQQPGTLGRSFSTPLNYVEARARPGEPVIFTYYFDRFQRDYYSHANLPPFYLGNQNQPIVPEQANQQVAEIMRSSLSSWLVLRPDEYNPEEVEKALNVHAYAGQKEWFEGGRAVVHYFAPLFIIQKPGGPVWDAGVQLNHWGLSYNVPAGDAVRLEFVWQRTADVTERLLVGVDLSDDSGHVWAQRLGEPCNGLCPTNKWDRIPFLERQALYVPPDTPPGVYHLRLYWLRADGALIQGQSDAQQTLRQDRVFLADVTVDPPQPPVPATPALSDVLSRRVRNGLVLRSAGLTDETVRAGAHLEVPLQWEVTGLQPQLDVQLELVGPATVSTAPQPLGPPSYPSQFWTPGRLVRTQSVFDLPGSLGTGDYEVRLIMTERGRPAQTVSVSLGRLSLSERPRRFELPAAGVATTGAWHQGISLARVVLPETARPGAELPLTLIWRAQGPADRNWKVFIHLIGSAGEPLAQGDAFPINNGDGPAPTTTWRPGEVILDDHRVNLPPDLPPGVYSVLVGLYEEGSNQRLPLNSGGDAFKLPITLTVKGP